MPDHSPRRITADELLEQAGWLRALSLRLARDAASADDLTQGVLVRALGRPPAAGRPLRPWLASVLRSLARRARRGEGRRAERERRAARSEVAPSHSSYLEQFEEQRRLAELVAELEEPYRTVIVRRFFAGESAAKIARETGRPAASVRSQIARGLARLREMHGEAHGGDHLRSLAALGMAAGSGAPFGAPVAGIPSGLAPVLAMKISTKLVTVTVLPILILTGWFGVQMLVGPPHQPELVEAAQPVVLVGDASEGERALTPAPSSGEERTSLSPSVAPGTGTVPQTAPVEPRTTIALRVVDERGKSIAGAVLEFIEESGESAGLAASEPSEHDGRIELDVPREVRFQGFSSDEWLTRLALRASGFATLFFHDSVHDGERTELGDRMMAPGGSIAGRVVTASGMPANDIEIVAMHGSPAQADGSWETAVVFKHDGPRRDEALPRTRTDEVGRFTLMGVPAQPLNLWFHAPDVPWNVSETLTLNAGEHREGVELELPTLGRDDQILGRVLRPDGTPAVGARVRTRLGPFWSGRALSGPVRARPDEDSARGGRRRRHPQDRA